MTPEEQPNTGNKFDEAKSEKKVCFFIVSLNNDSVIL